MYFAPIKIKNIIQTHLIFKIFTFLLSLFLIGLFFNNFFSIKFHDCPLDNYFFSIKQFLERVLFLQAKILSFKLSISVVKPHSSFEFQIIVFFFCLHFLIFAYKYISFQFFCLLLKILMFVFNYFID